LQERLIKQLHKGIAKILKENQSKPRIFLIVKSLHDIIANNMLTYAFDEVHKIRKMFKNDATVTLKVHETRGKIDFKMKHRDYESHFVMNVPEMYPLQPVQFKLKSCSLPLRYQTIYTQQADNLCSKLARGFDVNYALNERKIQTKNDAAALDVSDFRSTTAVDIRNDLKTMHKMSLFHNELMDNKGVRRKVRVMNKQVREEEQKEMELRKQMERACIDPDEQIAEPLPSLLVCVEYLVKQFTSLPEETCQACKKKVFPKNPNILHEYEEDPKKYVNKGKYPQRCSCGHWFHHECLDKFINVPPFEKPCEICKVKIKHPLFDTDLKSLERQWAVKQAKKRELDDISEFVDMFD